MKDTEVNMRTLKFRVWNTASKSFLDLVGVGDWGYYYLTLDGKFMVHYNKIGLGDNPLGEAKEEHLSYMVPQQYTGCKDKNGKEICEGDIVKYQENIICLVEFFAGMFMCSCNDQTDMELGYLITDKLEIIGNFYENRELYK